MIKVIGVRFKKAGKIYYFDPAGLDIEKGNFVVVETARGIEFGECVIGLKEINENDLKVCNKFLDENITYEDFIKNINEYKNKIDKNKGAKEESLITKYKYVFIIVGVVFVITIIFILIRNHKRNVLD